MMGFMQALGTLGSHANIGVTKLAKVALDPVADTLLLAKGVRGINPTVTGEKLGRIGDVFDGLGNATHLNTVGVDDVLEMALPNGIQLLPHAAYQAGIINRIGLDGYVRLVRETTPNPFSIFRNTELPTRFNPAV
jgi:hypothetical protein